MSDSRPCKACGMAIEFRHGPDSKLIPLQKVRTVYALDDELHGGRVRKIATEPSVEAYYVSHWETCSNVSEIKRRQGK